MTEPRANVEWRDGVPVSTKFEDPYYALADGAGESAHVFLDGNGLPDRFRPGFHIGELGFGTGLNLFTAGALWRQTGQRGRLRFTSFEIAPLSPDDMRRALGQFPHLHDIAEPVIDALAGAPAGITNDWVELEIVLGDANDTLPAWRGAADAWFLDGFAPARNPELWSPDLLQAVADRTAPGGTAATYSAAGHVRRALTEAGFTVERRPGFGRKRHMTIARLA